MNLSVKRIEKPWGYELLFAKTRSYAGKILVIYKGESLSLQVHQKKDETIYVYEGLLEVQFGEEIKQLKPGEALHIPPQKQHRMKALEESKVFEVSTPELDDVVRLEDHYGRV